MALIWYDNFEDQTAVGSEDSAFFLNIPPYKQFFEDAGAATANLNIACTISGVRGRGGVWYTRSGANSQTASISRRALKIPRLSTTTFGCNLSGIASRPDRAAPIGHFGLLADTPEGLFTIFCIKPGFGPYAGTLYWNNLGTLQQEDLFGNWPIADSSFVEFAVVFTKSANDSPNTMTNLSVYLDSHKIFFQDALNNAFHVDDLYFSFLGPLATDGNQDVLDAGGIGINTAVLPSAQTGTAIDSISRVRIHDPYLLDDTGPPPFNKRLGKVRIDTRLPISDIQAEMTRPSAATSNASVVAQAPIVTTNYLEGAVGQSDEYNLQPIAAGQKILAVKTLTTGTKNVADGYEFRPFLRIGEAKPESDMLLDLHSTTYHTTIHETNPDTGQEWTSEEVNATTTGIQVVDITTEEP